MSNSPEDELRRLSKDEQEHMHTALKNSGTVTAKGKFMSNSTESAERQAFEKEFKSHGYDLRRIFSGRYQDDMTEGAWRGWQARAAIPKPTPQGTESAEREVFEKWWAETNPCNSLERQSQNPDKYFSTFAAYGWQAWQAAIRDSNAAAVELGKHQVLAQIRFIAANQDGAFADDLESMVDMLEKQELSNPQMIYESVSDAVRELEAIRDSNVELVELLKELLTCYEIAHDNDAFSTSICPRVRESLARHSSRMGESMGDAAIRKDAVRPNQPIATSPTSHASDCKTNGYDTPDGIVYAPENECDCTGGNRVAFGAIDSRMGDNVTE